MKIKSIEIKNCKSIEDEKIENLGDFNVFIGRNNSGKSNILEALAVQDIEFNPDQIHFEEDVAKIEITYETDIDYFLPNFKDKVAKKLENAQYGKIIEAKAIKHVLVHEKDKLKLEFIIETSVGQIKRVTTKENGHGSDGNLTFVEQLVKAPSQFVEVYGEYMPPSELEDLSMPDEFKKERKGYMLMDEVRIINEILGTIKKGRSIQFLKISDMRSIPKERSLIDEIREYIDDPRNHLKREKLMEYIRRIESYIYKVYTPSEGIKLTYEKYPKRGINFNDFGSGMLQLVEIIYRILRAENQIVLIEEPEMNMHPEAQRLLLDFLEDQSKDKQIFMTTHSPIFASGTKLKNVRLVTKDNKAKTHVNFITKKNIYKIIDELGVRPSDIFDDDAVVFVEGPSDVGIFQEFVKKLKLSLKIGFIDVEGRASMKYYANAKILQSKKVKIPAFAIFDGDTKKEKKHKKIKEKLVKELHLPSTQIKILNKNSIEDYLLIPRAIKKAFRDLSMSRQEIGDFLKKNNSKKSKKIVLDNLFRKGDLCKYKEEYGIKIAKAMKKDEIDREIKNIISEIVNLTK